MQTLKLLAGDAGKAKIIAKGKGEPLGVPALPLTGPVLVQLSAEGAGCFEAGYAATDFLRNDAALFKAKGGLPEP
jgi:hypothetical protein